MHLIMFLYLPDMIEKLVPWRCYVFFTEIVIHPHNLEEKTNAQGLPVDIFSILQSGVTKWSGNVVYLRGIYRR